MTLSPPPRTARVVALFALVVFVAACGSEPKAPIAPAAATYSVTVDVDTLTVLPADTTRVTASVATSGASSSTPTLTWSSSNPSVLTVDQAGVVVAVALGQATVTAQLPSSTSITAGGSRDATSTFTVIEAALGENTVVANGTNLQLTSDSATVAQGTLEFQNNGNVALKVGDVLVGGDFDGYVRRVETVTSTGQALMVTTGPAALTDAMEELAMDIADEFSLADAYAEYAASGGRSPGIYLPAGVELLSNGSLEFTGFNVGGLVSGALGPSASVSVNLNGNLDLLFGGAAKPGASAFAIDGKIKNFELKRLEVTSTARIVFSASATATVTGAPGGAASGRLQTPGVLTPKFIVTKRPDGQRGTTCTTVGPVPVCYKVTVSLPIYAEVTASIPGQFMQSINVDMGVTAGGRFRNGAWEGIWEPFGPGTSATNPAEQSGTYSIRFGAVPEIEIQLYEVAGPFIGIDGYATFTHSADAYAWKDQSEAGLDVFVGLRAAVMGVKLAEVSYSENVWSTVLGTTQGAFARLVIAPNPVIVELGQNQQLSVRTERISDGGLLLTPPLGWATGDGTLATVNQGGVVTGTGIGNVLVGAQIPGTPVNSTVDVSTGLMRLNATRIDAQHIFSVTECPQRIETLTVTNILAEPVRYSAAVDSDHLLEFLGGNITQSGEIPANGTATVYVHFTCGIAQTFQRALTLTAWKSSDPGTTQRYAMPVKVSVVMPM